jgi:hypothetical protein
LLYVLGCVALLVIMAVDENHVWPYLSLVAALLPLGLWGVFVLGLVAGLLPAPLDWIVMVAGVVGMASVNVALWRALRGLCRRRASPA